VLNFKFLSKFLPPYLLMYFMLSQGQIDHITIIMIFGLNVFNF